MAQPWKENHALFLISTGALAWLVPGGGHFALNERRRAVVIFVAIVLTFLIGLYVGSVGVVDPVHARPWYIAQMMNSPLVMLLGRIGATGDYRAFGRANEIGQIYTSIAGLLNLLCIVNAVYLAHLRSIKESQA
ncbi:MAG: hypothetical protein FJ280_05905 [Planctomycetes bacterium]|nr:hypothetical protein [Planctomycetota bacterium]